MPSNLFGDQGRDVGLEHAGAETHDDDRDAEKTDDSAAADVRDR